MTMIGLTTWAAHTYPKFMGVTPPPPPPPVLYLPAWLVYIDQFKPAMLKGGQEHSFLNI